MTEASAFPLRQTPRPLDAKHFPPPGGEGQGGGALPNARAATPPTPVPSPQWGRGGDNSTRRRIKRSSRHCNPIGTPVGHPTHLPKNKALPSPRGEGQGGGYPMARAVWATPHLRPSPYPRPLPTEGEGGANADRQFGGWSQTMPPQTAIRAEAEALFAAFQAARPSTSQPRSQRTKRSPPPRGEGQGGGPLPSARAATPPTPVPSPQRGRRALMPTGNLAAGAKP